MKVPSFDSILLWRSRHITDKQFMLLLALVIGVLTALAGLLLKWLIGFIEDLLTQHFSITGANWPYLVYPVVGILLTGLFVRYVVRDGVTYDRALSRWAVVRQGTDGPELCSHARYADEVAPLRVPEKMELTGKKGLGGFSANRFAADIDYRGAIFSDIDSAVRTALRPPASNTGDLT